ncbi:peptide chain release factor N(5)-glutamine methyltransferase [Marinobacter nanhaiticus D15-8W]|uniref:Release factor glutamine methyltransferase n=1 Tax=Marinobacter nanhaiticus D15-8W TaxID=626887 RepID=N6X6M3_9GAMM|nr:peptide chain release factor N(5)-glutamine methyltransferase [Marinobacter nanhaiticus]ENO16743.1 peptide chain release factor N(5)-glutamine methyltransferase [Marinobacter nanhaiticus D15-8W]BES72551.1 peptide chain release factor N(5)-glutamine methyltransferase [Marinobacter nanhaiticus D15-8W]
MNKVELTVAELLVDAAGRIGGDSPRLDAELLLSAVLDRSATWFRTWPERVVATDDIVAFERLVQQRVAGHPIAHLLGHQGFWSLSLNVSQHTLIPRPDTECLVEAALELPLPQDARVLDLGTGTGAIALALASERGGWTIMATDAVDDAVTLARDNARHLGLPVKVEKSHWFRDLTPERFDLIVSNPPYIAANDRHLGEGDVRFEPSSALVSGADGLDAIREITTQAPDWLVPGAWLMLEHGFDQGKAVRALFDKSGFDTVETRRDYGGNDRFTVGRWQADSDPATTERAGEK